MASLFLAIFKQSLDCIKTETDVSLKISVGHDGSEFPSYAIVVNCEQDSNDFVSIVVTLDGIIIAVKELQLENAFSPIDFKLDGIVILVNDVQ